MEEKPDAGINLLILKVLRGSPDLTFLSHERMASIVHMLSQQIHSRRIWDLTQIYFDAKILTEVLLHYPS